jgi:hypothetical protein
VKAGRACDFVWMFLKGPGTEMVCLKNKFVRYTCVNITELFTGGAVGQ